ncbi:MAG: hypothetical protein KTQ12_10410 [Dermatophilaceae bacterium]|nr:hypothetical protein [Dermatophilaceae bacterium]
MATDPRCVVEVGVHPGPYYRRISDGALFCARHRAQMIEGGAVGDYAPVGDDKACSLCDGHACEYRCGLRASDGGCSHAYDGPHSHRVCRRCSGTGVDRAGGEL